MNNLQEVPKFVNPIMRMQGDTWREYVEQKTRLFDQVESLPEDAKLVLTLHYYEGLSFADIGQVMGMKEWDAVVLHTQALVKLQSRIQDIF